MYLQFYLTLLRHVLGINKSSVAVDDNYCGHKNICIRIKVSVFILFINSGGVFFLFFLLMDSFYELIS